MQALGIPLAIVIAAIIVAGAVLAVPLVAPYRVGSAGTQTAAWRINAVTGEIQLERLPEAVTSRGFDLPRLSPDELDSQWQKLMPK